MTKQIDKLTKKERNEANKRIKRYYPNLDVDSFEKVVVSDKPAITIAQIALLEYNAKEGNKITATREDKTSTLWAGLGNRSGLHSFAYTLISEAWEKKSERFLKRLNKLSSNTIVKVFEYRNVTRDRGRWVEVISFEILNKKQ